jgi:hypothetical protein
MPSQAQKHVTHNEALQRLDALTQLVVEAIDASAPPTLPEAGAIYALGASPSGDWAGKGNTLAYWSGEAWTFFTPVEGWQAWDKSNAVLRVYRDGAWQPSVEGLQNLAGVGIGAAYDATNKLSVASAATLLNHDGSDHRLKLNKASGGDTASLLYQSNWTGHAEMGLARDTDFHVKVSGDGTNWAEAMVARAADGRVSFPSGAVPAPARAYVSTTAAQVVPDGVDYHAQFETMVYDTDGFYAAAAPDRLTIPEAGGYQLNTYAQVSSGFSIGDGWIVLQRYDSSDTLIGSYPASWITGFTAMSSPMVDCAAGDYFRLLLRQNSGADKNLFVSDDRNYLSITRVF